MRGLTDAQRLAVEADDAPLCVLAGAGSGKTTVLTRRVVRRVLDGSADPEHVLVVTFTKKAANELRRRIARLGVSGSVWAGTFHAAAYAQLRRYWADHDIRPPGILDDPTRLVRRILDDVLGADAGSHTSSVHPVWPRLGVPSQNLVGAVTAEVHWAQVRLVTPAGYSDAARTSTRTLPVTPDEMTEVYFRYGEEKRRRGVLDLDDLIARCAHLLETDDEAARAQRWRVRHLFVDEFQDLNPAQWCLLKAWLGGRSDLFVVGDPLQAVYGWNGADPTLIQRLPEMLPGTNVLRLDDNHRSSPQIVAAARAVIDFADDDRVPARDDAPASCLPQALSFDLSVGAPIDGPSGAPSEGPVDGPDPVIVGFDNDDAEAIAVSRWLRGAHRPGTSWSALAVLARTNARLEPIAAALRRAAIPYRITPRASTPSAPDSETLRKALALLHSQPAHRPLRNALAELVVSAHEEDAPQEDANMEGTDGRPYKHNGLSLEDRCVSTERLGLAPGYTSVSPKPRGLSPELARLADEHAAEEPGATVAAFLAWLSANDAASEPGGELAARRADHVELTTFHRAKGLEWRAVAVVGLEDGVVPISYARTPDALAEERRLLYVALTRAEEELWCSWAANRYAGDRSWPCDRSPFLDPVQAVVRAGAPTEDLETRRSHILDLRRQLPAKA